MADDGEMNGMEGTEEDYEIRNKIINEEYKIWKKNAPFLYDMMLSTALDWPSLTVQWFPDSKDVPDKPYTKQRLLIGTHTNGNVPNYLQIASVQLPKRSNPDLTDYNEDTGEIGGYGGGPGKQAPIEVKFNITQKIHHPTEVNKARYQPQNPDIISTFCSDGSVLVFNRAAHSSIPPSNPEPKPEILLIGHEAEGWGLSWSPFKEGHLASASLDNTVRLWDITKASKSNTKLNAERVYTHHTASVNDVQYHPAHEFLLGSVSDDTTLQIIDLRSADSSTAAIKSGLGQQEAINTLAFSPSADVTVATGGADKAVALWDLRNLKYKVHSLEGHNDAVFSLEWNPFEQSILGSSGGADDRRVIFWDLARIGEEQTPEDSEDGPPELLFIHGGHTMEISDFSWNKHDPWTVCSAAADNVVQVWKAAEAVVGSDDTDIPMSELET